MYISEIFNKKSNYSNELEEKVFSYLHKLNIEYQGVTNDVSEAMSECEEISKVLGEEIRKTVFLCNRQKTQYYLVVMPANKRFDTKTFAKNMECARVSFASEDDMINILGVSYGNASVMSIFNDTNKIVQVVLDKEVASNDFFACNTGISTTHIKFKTSDLIDKYLVDLDHTPKIIEL